MKLGDHIRQRNETASAYSARIGLPIPCITRYLRGERGLSARSVQVILEDAQGALSWGDLIPNPYKGNGGGEATKK
jgi:hypothetical protein